MYKYPKAFFNIAFTLILSFIFSNSFGQNEVDSTKSVTLSSVIIKAFEQNKKLKDVAASISYIGKATLSNFSPTSIVSALNTVPGVRMEERSPGSYRLNIRGSSLRSPFGVRNVKIYYNDIPLTDPGGNTYFNQLGYYNFNSIEIIKGANNSVYGAGTGGAMLVESISANEKPSANIDFTAGSYLMNGLYASLTTGSNKSISKFGAQHLESNGYRDHSALRRNVYSWDGSFNVGENKLIKTTFLYGDLFYQTPGALTKSEYDNNPKAARPSVGAVPGASVANAFIHQQMFLAGATYSQPIIRNINNKTTLYGNFAELRNPSIASYGKSSEPNFGGRTVFNYEKTFTNGALHATAGAEYQKGYISVSIHKNVRGNQDSLRTYDEINNLQDFIFSQLSVDFSSWTFLAGASFNKASINFERFTPAPLGIQSRTFNNQLAPRFAIMKKFTNINIYSSVSKGFSPPTTAELLPTGGAINLGLNAEKALNFELGIKATLLKYLYLDINAFTFSLTNTIVQRRNASATDFYYNAGNTKQHGIESYLSYQLFTSSKKILRSNISIGYTLYDFHYNDFKQQNIDYSGNQLPSVAPNTFNALFDITLLNGLFGSLNYYYSDKIALNDANSQFASSYALLGFKCGIQKILAHTQLRFSFGGDNLTDIRYSLGNDINGFAGRYYNAAPGRNFYFSLGIGFLKKPNPTL